jgi:hypothetical protein
MAVRIGDFVLSGELRNTRRNGVFGWIEFAPDYGIRIELTGNFTNSLAGKHLRFQGPKAQAQILPTPEDLPDFVNDLANRQIGVVGEVQLKKVQVPDMPLEQFSNLSPGEMQSHLVEKDCLYLEWFSQNGRVVAELYDPQVEFVENQGSDDPNLLEGELDDGSGLDSGFTEIQFDENGIPLTDAFGPDEDEDDDEDDELDSDDPYDLFGSDLQKRVRESLGEATRDFDEEHSDAPESGGKRPWDEVIPGLDPETKAMYEQWDEIFEGKKDEPIAYLFEKPMKLPRPEKVASNEEAEEYVKMILAQLALLSVALDVCEHFSPMDTYRLLMNEILPTAKVHPNLAASEMVQHYATSDYCPACEAEFEAEYEGSQGSDTAINDVDSFDDSDDDSPGDGPAGDDPSQEPDD